MSASPSSLEQSPSAAEPQRAWAAREPSQPVLTVKRLRPDEPEE
jgi:hypothetical protein